jgi:hypothetical protein
MQLYNNLDFPQARSFIGIFYTLDVEGGALSFNLTIASGLLAYLRELKKNRFFVFCLTR